MWTIFRWIGIGMIGVAVVLGVVLLLFDGNWIKGYVASQASNVMGRTVTITGDLEVDLGLKPTIRAEGIHLANATWASAPHLLELRELAVQIDLVELLQGNIVLPEIELAEPVVTLERSKQGQLNWPTATGGAMELPTLGRFHLRDGRLVYDSDHRQENITATIPELTATTENADQHLEVRASGQLADQPLQFTMTTGSLETLQTTTPVPLHTELTLGDMQARLDGTMTQPLQLAGADLDVSLDGAPPEALFTILNVPVSPPEPLHVQGHLSHDGSTWAMREIKTKLGKSDIAGAVTLDTAGEQPFINADLSSQTLDISSLINSTSGHQANSTKPDANRNGIIPKASFDPERLRTMEGKLNFQGHKVIVAKQTLQNVSLEGRLQDGHLSLRPQFDLAGGDIQAQLEVKGGDTPVQNTLKATVKRVDLAPVLNAVGVEAGLTGIVDGEADISSTGHALEQLVASADGRVSATLQDADYHTDVSVTLTTANGKPADASPRWRLLSDGRVLGESLHLEGRLQHHDQTWTFKNFQTTYGESHVSGQLAFDRSGKRPALQGDLQSEHLDIAALTGGGNSQSETPSAKEGQQQNQVVPEFAIDPARLRVLDANLQFTGKEIVTTHVTLQNVQAKLTLQDGHLVFKPKADLVDGTVQAKIEAKGSETPMQNKLHAEFDSIDLKDVLARFDLPQKATGAVNGRLDLAGSGHTVSTVLDTVDGDVVLTMAGGRLDQLLVELAGLDIGEAIASAFFNEEKGVKIRCLAVDFNVQDGKMTPDPLILSTTDTRIIGDGVIDLSQKKMDLKFKPKGKDFSFFSADAPLHLQGPFDNLSASTNVGQALWSLATPMETQEAQPADCQTLLKRARQDSSSSQP